MLPGSNVRVVPTVGLTGADYYLAGPSQYIMVGMNAEIMETKSVYDPFENIVKIQSGVSYGVGVFDPASFVIAN
jgi:hypothetical protein